MTFTLRPSEILRGLVQRIGEVLREDLLAMEAALRSRLSSLSQHVSREVDAVRTDFRDDLRALEARLKAHNEALVEETRAVLLREMRAEFDARLGGGTASAPTELPRPPLLAASAAPAGLPPGRYHP